MKFEQLFGFFLAILFSSDYNEDYLREVYSRAKYILYTNLRFCHLTQSYHV
jgi:hypothetical protein